MLDEDAGVEAAAGADEELSVPELDFVPLSPDEGDDESLPPSLLLEEFSEEAFGAADDFDG